jgi:hypothetical protein
VSKIIVRTNPNRKRFITGEEFECSQCRKPFFDYDAAIACAEKNYKDRTGRDPVTREEQAA